MNITNIKGTVTLSNGVKMPYLGIGVYLVNDGEEIADVVGQAIRCGFRLIDTATAYKNEAGVGKTISAADISREDLFLTTKVANNDQGYEETLRAFDASLHKLGLEYVDLYMIHWPVKSKIENTWKALEKIYESGLARAIGVSNFGIDQLKILLQSAKILPMVDQFEFHPLLQQKPLRDFCKQYGVQVEAYSPLIQGHFLKAPFISELAEKYNRTFAQVILRWDLQHGAVSIPKSSNPARIKENSEIFDFEISEEDMMKIDSLDSNQRFGSPPEKFM
jgi:methylglyoxal/glyoxal reductase